MNIGARLMTGTTLQACASHTHHKKQACSALRAQTIILPASPGRALFMVMRGAQTSGRCCSQKNCQHVKPNPSAPRHSRLISVRASRAAFACVFLRNSRACGWWSHEDARGITTRSNLSSTLPAHQLSTSASKSRSAKV